MNFDQRVHKILLKIPKGKVTTYKEIAEALGTKAYRAVGSALNRNKHPEMYPCYKVVNSDGRVGGFALGTNDKIRRLQKDGIEVVSGKIKDFNKKIYRLS